LIVLLTLLINEDIFLAKVDPYEHYFISGKNENRIFNFNDFYKLQSYLEKFKFSPYKEKVEINGLVYLQRNRNLINKNIDPYYHAFSKL